MKRKTEKQLGKAVEEYPFAFMQPVYEQIMAEARRTYPYASYRNMERTVGMNQHSFLALKKGGMSG